MQEMTYVAATGMLGAGFNASSLQSARERRPAFIGCDAGSVDGGPQRLGTGTGVFGALACKRDLRLCLELAQELHIPLIIGSCHGAGIDSGVDEIATMVTDIARELGRRLRLARIYSELEPRYVADELAAGRMLALPGAPVITENTILRSEHIVAMMGVEPIQRALENGADVVLAGRASDASIYSALPLLEGFAPGLVWHAAKIMECGSAATSNRKSQDCMLCTLRPDDFLIEALAPELVCTPLSIAAHALYENGNPFLLHEPGGTLDIRQATYDAVDDRRVKVAGGTFTAAAPYRVKLEGAELAGYQSFTLGSVRDPIILGQLDSWTEGIRARTIARIESAFGLTEGTAYDYELRVYGRNGTLGATEPIKKFEGHEALLFIRVLASTAELANDLILAAKHIAIHYPVPDWSGSITGMGHPLTPGCINEGAMYRFNLNHTVPVEDPCALFRFAYDEVGP